LSETAGSSDSWVRYGYYPRVGQSAEPDFITGQQIVVYGGFSLEAG